MIKKYDDYGDTAPTRSAGREAVARLQLLCAAEHLGRVRMLPQPLLFRARARVGLR
jgi:hypothetical protein